MIEIYNKSLSILSLFEGHLTTKSDVYSFGVVLLEMLSGKRAIDKNRPTGQHNLVEWAKPYLTNKRRLLHVMDIRLEGQYSLNLAQKAANLALQCLSIDAKFRPDMDEVVKTLEQLQDSKDILKGAQKEQRTNSDARKPSKRSAADGSAPATSYPRPSKSLLFA